ncbi:MAG: TetR family transcriptional regulator [Lachnospiraceae bacterium]|nr:TetR family transcriptional regulator [Lachnospiraceae bacterium]
MSYSSDQTRQRILESAKREFSQQGYRKANLRKIADDAKVTTGALYNHFKNKDVLFDELVKEAAEGLLCKYKEMHSISEGACKDNKMYQKSEEGTDWVTDYIYDHFEEFRLIFCCSEGHEYSHFLDELAEIEEEAYRNMLSLSGKGASVGDFFVHVICSSGLRDIYEVVSHNLSRAEAKEFMQQVKRFRFAGWKEILGQ